MLGFVFGFNARLGRLHFFLATIALAIVMTAICFLVAAYAFSQASPGTLRAEDLMHNWGAIAAIVLFAVATFLLQSMRIRDIGWDPVCVVPAWIALMIVDRLVAAKFPAWAVGQEHQATMVGGLVNFVLLLILMFWPSADHEGSSSASDHNPGGRSEKAKSSIVTARLARVSQGHRESWT